MAETLEHRQQIERSLEDIHKSLVAVSRKMAQLQIDAEDASDLTEVLDDGMTALSPLTERIEGLESGYRMETNRMRNEGELEG